MDKMIIQRGIWTCFHCGREYDNKMLNCSSCNASKKHTENMRKSLGMDASPERMYMRGMANRNEDITRSRETLEKYKRIKPKLESFICRFFIFALSLKVFKDIDNKILKDTDTLYYGFDEEGYHYTIRRDKI